MAIFFPEDIFHSWSKNFMHPLGKNCRVTPAFAFALHIAGNLLFITLFSLSTLELCE